MNSLKFSACLSPPLSCLTSVKCHLTTTKVNFSGHTRSPKRAQNWLPALKSWAWPSLMWPVQMEPLCRCEWMFGLQFFNLRRWSSTLSSHGIPSCYISPPMAYRPGHRFQSQNCPVFIYFKHFRPLCWGVKYSCGLWTWHSLLGPSCRWALPYFHASLSSWWLKFIFLLNITAYIERQF